MPIAPSTQKPSTKREPSLTSTILFLEERLPVASIMQPAQAVLGMERAKDVLNRMTEHGYDYAPVADRGEVSHFVSRESLEEHLGGSVLECAQVISAHNLVADSCPLSDALPRVVADKFLLVLRGKSISHIVTIADLDRLPVAMYFLSVLHAFEESLTTRLSSLADEDVQQKLEAWVASIDAPLKQSAERSKLMDSIRAFEKKKRNNQELQLVNCLHLAHKMELFKSSRDRWWSVLGSPDAAAGEQALIRINTVRNAVAHGDAIATSTTGWKDALRTVQLAQDCAGRLAP